MRRAGFTSAAFLLLVPLAWVQIRLTTSGKPVQAAETLDVSLLQILANPAAYDQKRVRLVGFCHLEPDWENSLYLHREDFDRMLPNSLRLDAARDKPLLIEKHGLSDQYVLIEGTFRADEKESSSHSGRLEAITKMERWPTRKEVRRITM
jgi:hypothetical protein